VRRKRLLNLPRRSGVNDIAARAIGHRSYSPPFMACIGPPGEGLRIMVSVTRFHFTSIKGEM
jgi:hypothetical protein